MSETRATVAGIAVATGHYIGGEWVDSSTSFEDHSPLDWNIILARVSRGGAPEAARAVDAALAAFPAWSALGPEGRAPYLHRLADLIDRDVERLAAVECLDMAMLEESLRQRVIGRGARNFRAYADLAVDYVPRRWDSQGTHNTVLRMPAGPTVVITPWNAPFMLATWKCAPALAAGNTVILKPAEWSPLSAAMLMDLADEAGFPPGVLNLVQGYGNEAGAALVGDERVRRISFTGSPETGRVIGRVAADHLVPFTAELGGKGPLIVLDDADLDAAALTASRMYDDAGQVCLAGTRLLVQASVRDEFVARVTAAAAALVPGDSRLALTTLSPLIHPDHLARVDGFVTRAREAGDHVLFGGVRWRPDGLWYEPTLIEPHGNDAEIVQHEVFGPVLTVQTFGDDAEAAALANSTPYGLSAIVYTSSRERADALGAALRAGTVWVNTFLVRDLTAPFGGIGISGLGREGGNYALDFYSDLKTYQVREGTTHG